MSRLGKKPIAIPAGVEVKIQGRKVSVKGPRGELSREFRDEISIEIKDNNVVLAPRIKTKLSMKLWGTYASLLKSMLEGVTKGFSKKLLMEGIGFRGALQGQELTLFLGFSHPVKFAAPDGIELQIDKNLITVSGIDKEIVGRTASRLRAIKKPEPYKGKGIRYQDEIIKRKAGKKAVSAA
jgi:large subunit ribosomal protein L6